jgi:hypothetical protein
MNFVYASLRINGIRNNSCFSLDNRDNCNYPLWLLREKFYLRGVILNTPDLNVNKSVKFEIHIDVQKSDDLCPAYLFLWETNQVNPRNRTNNIAKKYRRVFSWDDGLVEAFGYVKFYLPVANDYIPYSLGWSGRDKFLCAIAGNKTTSKKDKRELYSKRVETFKWFERHALNEFDLFGNGWDSPARSPGLLNKFASRFLTLLYRWRDIKPFPSYRGPVVRKREILARYRFSICYENMSELPGYITEKIFDCFFAGTVPVYWGASNIFDYIPETCFIDRRKFSDHESMYHFLSNMSESDYMEYQSAIRDYLLGPQIKSFNPESFSSKAINVIMADFG